MAGDNNWKRIDSHGRPDKPCRPRSSCASSDLSIGLNRSVRYGDSLVKHVLLQPGQVVHVKHPEIRLYRVAMEIYPDLLLQIPHRRKGALFPGPLGPRHLFEDV